MAFKIMPHGRLQEWVAEEKGYFKAEGLEYSFVPEGDYGIRPAGRDGAGQIKTGAFETFGAGRDGAKLCRDPAVNRGPQDIRRTAAVVGGLRPGRPGLMPNAGTPAHPI